MDPISITTACITFTGVVTASVKAVRSLAVAKEDCNRLITKLELLDAALKHYKDLLLLRKAQELPFDTIVQSVTFHVERTKELLEKLNGILVYEVLQSGSCIKDAKISRSAWMRGKKKILSLVDEVARGLEHLGHLHSSLAMSDLLRMHTTLTTLSEEVKTANELSRRRIPPVASLAISTIPAPHMRTQETLLRLPPMIRQATGFTEAHLCSIGIMRCEEWCSCVCHRIFQLTTSIGILGAVTLRARGWWRGSCNERTCRRTHSTGVMMTIFTPSWAPSRVVGFALTIPHTGKISINVSAPNVVPLKAPIWIAVTTGEIGDVIKLFESHDALPTDVDDIGRSLLHLAITTRQWNMARFLLINGADPDAQDSAGRTGRSLALTKSFDLSVEARAREQLRTTFGCEDDGGSFTLTHKIILGLSLVDLEDRLTTSTSEIDTYDDKNRTPIWWAAFRGDEEKVKVLLKFGADPNKGIGSYPLHQAAGELYTEIVEFLLSAGADVNVRNVQGSTATVVACMRVTTDLSTLEVLRKHGADFTIGNVFGRGAIATAAPHCTARCIAYLVDCGAHLGGQNGELPLAVAIRHKNVAAVNTILRYRPIIDHTVDEILYIIREVTRHLDLRILELLCAQSWTTLRDLPTERLDDMVRHSVGTDVALDTAYEQLLAKIRDGMEPYSEDDEEFVDALGELP